MEVLIGIEIGGGGGDGEVIGRVGGVIGGGEINELSGSSKVDAWVDEVEKYCQFVVEEDDDDEV